MTIRPFEYDNGPSSPNAPTTTDASADSDTVNYGQLSKRYSWGKDVASYAALRALDANSRADYQTRFVSGPEEDWYFNPASTAPDDGATVLLPNDNPGTGRWLIKPGSGGGGGSGAGGSGIETLAQKLENEKQNVFTEDLDNSVGASAQTPLRQNDFKATLLKNHSATDTSIEAVWNAEAVNQSDKNMDSATGWSATGQASSLSASTTAGDFQVGSAGLKYDKLGSGTEASIRFDTGTQTRQFNGLSRVWMYVKLPSVTNLSNVLLRIYADSTSNFQTFTNTTDFAGNALTTGWNLLMFDISTGGSAGGTGWDITKLCRYIEVGVTTSTSGQTYTGIIFDAVYFSYYNPAEIGSIGTEYTLFDTSNKEDIVIAASNTRYDGRMTLVSALANNFTGGLTGSSRGRLQRSTIDVSGTAQMPMDNDATFSGAIVTTQELRLSSFARQDVSGKAFSFIDMIGIMAFPINTIGGSTIGVTDPADLHLNMLNGDTFDFFRPLYSGGRMKYDFIKTASLTASSTASGGTTTLTVSPTSLAVGDFAVKRHLASHSVSVVGKAVAESFSAAPIKTDPDGVQLLDTGIACPNRRSLWGHWALGGSSQVDASRNRAPSTAGPSLTATGTPNISGTFQRGDRAWVGSSAENNYFSIPTAASLDISGYPGLAMHSMWLYFDGSYGSSRTILHRMNGGFNGGFSWYISGSALKATLQMNSSTVDGANFNVGWNHVFLVLNDAGTHYMYINGVKSSTMTVSPGNGAVDMYLGVNVAQSSYESEGLKMAQWQAWSGGAVLTQAQVRSIWNGGYYRPVGFGPMQRYMYETAGVSGQKLSMRARISRSTSAVTPTLWKAGLLVG